MSAEGSGLLSRTALDVTQYVTAFGAIVAALVIALFTKLETALVVATAALGVLVFVVTAVTGMWATGSTGGSAVSDGAVPREAATLSITTQGVVLGLLALSDRATLSVTAKVGASSLVVGVLAGVLLYFLVAGGIPDARRGYAAGYLFNLTFWALGYGLLCIAASLWLR